MHIHMHIYVHICAYMCIYTHTLIFDNMSPFFFTLLFKEMGFFGLG